MSSTPPKLLVFDIFGTVVGWHGSMRLHRAPLGSARLIRRIFCRQIAPTAPTAPTLGAHAPSPISPINLGLACKVI